MCSYVYVRMCVYMCYIVLTPLLRILTPPGYSHLPCIGTPRNKLIRTIEQSRHRSRRIAQELDMFGEDEVQNRDSTLIQVCIKTLIYCTCIKPLYTNNVYLTPLPINPY
jgi:hypothetical protein